MKAAVDCIEHTYSWMGKKPGAKEQKMVGEARQTAQLLETGTKVEESKANQAIQNMAKESRTLQNMLPLARK